MKRYIVTCDNSNAIEILTLHQYVGGQAYIAIASGTHNELARYLKENNIDMIL